eukprot:scaffold26970_cov104-Isochrysis_galbana.AAC.5
MGTARDGARPVTPSTRSRSGPYSRLPRSKGLRRRRVGAAPGRSARSQPTLRLARLRASGTGHVRIGRAARNDALHKRLKYVLPVLADEANWVKPDAEPVAHQARVLALALAAFAAAALLLVVPVGHVDADNVVALLLQQQRGHRRVHPTRQAHCDSRQPPPTASAKSNPARARAKGPHTAGAPATPSSN